jgi:hypothetical protein
MLGMFKGSSHRCMAKPQSRQSSLLDLGCRCSKWGLAACNGSHAVQAGTSQRPGPCRHQPAHATCWCQVARCTAGLNCWLSVPQACRVGHYPVQPREPTSALACYQCTCYQCTTCLDHYALQCILHASCRRNCTAFEAALAASEPASCPAAPAAAALLGAAASRRGDAAGSPYGAHTRRLLDTVPGPGGCAAQHVSGSGQACTGHWAAGRPAQATGQRGVQADEAGWALCQCGATAVSSGGTPRALMGT